MSHPSEDDLILLHYAETEVPAEIEAHLRECEACRGSFESLRRTLAHIKEEPVPERDETYGAALWQRIAPRLGEAESDVESRRPQEASRASRRPIPGPWRRFVLPAALAASLVAGFLLGRHSRPEGRVAQPLSAPVRERILLVAVGDHLERSQIMLVELSNATGNGSVDISSEQRIAGELVEANRLYRQTAVRAGETGVASVLDELERVLIEIAAGPSTLSASDLEVVQKRIEARGILFKVRVIGSQMREREKDGPRPSRNVVS